MVTAQDFNDDDYIVTYPNGNERLVWGEAAAVNEAEAYGGNFRLASEKKIARRTKKAADSDSE